MVRLSKVEMEYFSKHPDALREVYNNILSEMTNLGSARILRNDMDKVVMLGLIFGIPLWSSKRHVNTFSAPRGNSNTWNNNRRIKHIHNSRKRTPVHPNLSNFHNSHLNLKRYLHNGGFER